MTESSKRKEGAEHLRRRAEARIKTGVGALEERPSSGRVQEILHELRVHQIELEMQNEELRRAQKELEVSRERYFDLYDLAPVGYFTLSQQGVILEANLTAAKLLGMKRGAVVGRPLTHFILFADAASYAEHHHQLFETGVHQVFELRLVRQDGTQFWVRLEANAATRTDNTPVCRAVVSNITERKLAEDALQQAFNEIERKVEFRTRELQNALAALQRANHALRMMKEGEDALARACCEYELLQDVCRIVVDVGRMKLAWVGFPRPGAEKTICPVAGEGKGDEDMKNVRVTWIDDAHGPGPVRAAMRTGRASVCRATAASPCLTGGYAASIALPLIREKQRLGVLAIYSAEADAFNDEEVTMLKRLAGDLALGIILLRSRTERSRLQQELLTISEREKQLIAQELHDGLCQHLAGTAMMGTLLARRLEARGDPEASQARMICDLLNTGVDEARNLSHGLHPVKPEGEGLVEALLQYSKTTANLYQINCTFRSEKSVVIDNQVVSTHLLRITQEAVHNAMKHGEATRVMISLFHGRNGLKLSIRDNGIGIPRDLAHSRGLGMQIMNHRAASIGATLKVTHGSRGGTVVSCTLATI